MKKRSLLKSMLLLCALIVGSSSVWADPTFSFQQNTNAYGWTGGTPASGNASTCTLSEDDKFTNGDIEFIYTSKGGASTDMRWWNTTDGLRLYGASGPATNQFKIKALNSRKIKSITITGTFTLKEVASPATGSISSNTYTAPSGGITEVEFKGTHTSGAKNIKTVTVTLEPIDPTITFNNGSVNVGQNLNLSSLFTSNSDGAITYTITSGDSYASIDGNTLTGVAEGDVTVKATQAKSTNFNAGEATATITVQEALVLSGITITTPPTTTTYTEGESFDPTGMVVTATYTNSSTSDVTAYCTFSPSTSTALTLSDDKVTVSYTENAVEKTTTHPIIVNPYIQPLSVNFSISQNLFPGVEFSSNQTTENTITASVENVEMSLNKGGSPSYVKDGEMRGYGDNGTLVFNAPTGFYLRKIVFTKGSNWSMTLKSGDAGALSSQTWSTTTNTDNVTFEFGGRTDITGITVMLSKTSSIAINKNCNDGKGNIYGTYSNDFAFIVPNDITVSAVGVSDGKLVVTDYSAGDIVKAGTGVMVKAVSGDDVNQSILLTGETGTEKSGNLLKASGDAGITAANMDEADTKFYRLTIHNGTTLGFWWGAASGAAFALAANKAYLAVPTGTPAPEFFGFGNEATSIESIMTQKTKGEVYDLQGRKVANPAKGLYIVNGKKYVVK